MQTSIVQKTLYTFCQECKKKYIIIDITTGKKKKIHSEYPVCMRCVMIDYNAQQAKKVRSS